MPCLLVCSVVEYLQGKLGQPEGGLPEQLQKAVVKDRPLVTGRPGQDMAAMNLKSLEAQLRDKYEWRAETDARNVLSAALYPKVFDEYM